MKTKELIVSPIYNAKGNIVGQEYHGELIRCKECKHHKGYNCDRLYGFQDAFTFLDNDYCSKGERNETD